MECPYCKDTFSNPWEVKLRRIDKYNTLQTLRYRCYGCEKLWEYDRTITISPGENLREIKEEKEE